MAKDVSVTFRGELDDLKDSLGSMKGEIESWGKQVTAIGVGAFAAWGASAAISEATQLFRESAAALSDYVAMAREAAVVDAKLEAVLLATGNAAGFTADELQEIALGLRSIAGVDDDVIKGAQTILATFKQIKGDEFERTTKAALDMSAVLGGDLSSAAMQLGKALNDPERGLTMLTKSGVSFTAQQSEMVKRMVELGDVAGAQNVILGEMEAQFGGAAKAAAEAAGGGFTQLAFAADDLKESIGSALLPVLDELQPAAKVIAQHIQELGKAFREWGEDLATGASDWLPGFENSLFEMIATLETVFARLFGSVDKAKLSWLEFRDLIDKSALGEGPGEATGLAALLGRDKNFDLTRGLLGDSITGMDDATRSEMERLRATMAELPSFDEEFKSRLAALMALREEMGADEPDQSPRAGGTSKLDIPTFADLMGMGQNALNSPFVKEFQNLGSELADAVTGAFGGAAGGLGQGLFDLLGGESNQPEGESFRAAIESADSLFARIQGSAASIDDRREERKLAVAEQTRDEATKVPTKLDRIITILQQQGTGGQQVAVLGA